MIFQSFAETSTNEKASILFNFQVKKHSGKGGWKSFVIRQKKELHETEYDYHFCHPPLLLGILQ